ncbi:hypothetical protein HKX48_007405 [Thoreauomyces humboldtii]|nr:hypothetical protein HKX48_007405 [Thoreauomyces humboldtii]
MSDPDLAAYLTGMTSAGPQLAALKHSLISSAGPSFALALIVVTMSVQFAAKLLGLNAVRLATPVHSHHTVSKRRTVSAFYPPPVSVLARTSTERYALPPPARPRPPRNDVVRPRSRRISIVTAASSTTNPSLQGVGGGNGRTRRTRSRAFSVFTFAGFASPPSVPASGTTTVDHHAVGPSNAASSSSNSNPPRTTLRVPRPHSTFVVASVDDDGSSDDDDDDAHFDAQELERQKVAYQSRQRKKKEEEEASALAEARYQLGQQALAEEGFGIARGPEAEEWWVDEGVWKDVEVVHEEPEDVHEDVDGTSPGHVVLNVSTSSGRFLI